MLRYIKIKEDLNARVETLVTRGDYADFNSVAVTALENLVTAEEELWANPGSASSGIFTSPAPESPSPAAAASVESESAWVGWDRNAHLDEDMLVPLAVDEWDSERVVPVEKWLFGQENRCFPAKVNSRIFINLMAARKEPLELHDAAHEISLAATKAFSLLHALDLKRAHQKDDLLSTGFPTPNSEKSAVRYANQFVAYESTQGRITGLMAEWKLVGVKHMKNRTYLFPTKACVDFSALQNPLLDRRPDHDGVEKFNDEEIEWALQHITMNVPVEAFAFRTILSGIQSGAKSPAALDEYVRACATEKSNVTKEFVSTQRTGAVSRMADLNMVMRVRDGIRIFYEPTDRGNNWLQSQNQSKRS